MASVAKFKENEAPRLLSHCSRTQKNPGSHIHQERTCLNFNMAEGRHEGMSDYEFVKDRIHQDGVRMLKRDDVKTVCSWAITLPRELCHEAVGADGEEYYAPDSEEECHEFFQHAYDFFKQKHGEQNVISAYVHMDENVPHMHFTFVPVVKDKARHDYKVCAKEALADCYSAKFQIELQDYISAKMGKELNMVKKDTVDYERNVKELKKKTLNERCAYLSRQISISEEELARKQRIIQMSDKQLAAEKSIDDIKVSSSNGFTVMRDVDWLRVKPLLKNISAMKAERAELKKMLIEFEQTSTAKQNQTLTEQAEQLINENARLEHELEQVTQFMSSLKMNRNESLLDLYKRNQAEKERRTKELFIAEKQHER